MFTQCRGCGEIFRVVVDDLVTASAMVRCSSCGAVFNSLDTLSEYKPNENSDLILHENDNPPPLLTHEFKQSVIEPQIQKPSSDENDSITVQEDLDEGVTFNVKPDFVAENDEKKSSKSILMWLLFTLVLIIVLLWQAADAVKKGSLKLPEGEIKQFICEKIECYSSVKTHSNLDKIALVSRSIREHPGRDNALIITTGIINSDSKAQPFPALEVKMSNLNGEVVAMRRFLPSEYLSDDIIQQGMQPNVLIPITLELKSPGKNAVAFEVGFSQAQGDE
jgi:predicted Zn finger-like uncharacterized protein